MDVKALFDLADRIEAGDGGTWADELRALATTLAAREDGYPLPAHWIMAMENIVPQLVSATQRTQIEREACAIRDRAAAPPAQVTGEGNGAR